MLRSDSVMSKVLCVILHVLLACTVPPLPLLLRRSTVRRRSSSARWRACKGTQPSCSPQPTNSPTARPPFAERDPVQEAVAYLYQQTNGFHWACPLRRLQHQHNIQVEHMLESLVQQVKLMLANPNLPSCCWVGSRLLRWLVPPEMAGEIAMEPNRTYGEHGVC